MEQEKRTSVAIGDELLVKLWLNGRPATTRLAYAREIGKLSRSIGKPLADATLSDLQDFAGELAHLALRSQARAIDAVRSFYAFHAKVETLPRNPAAALLSPKIPNDLAERILTEEEMHRLLAASAGLERTMLTLLYFSGARAHELCGLRWRHVTPRDGGAQLTIHGKGGKTRFVLLGDPLAGALLALRPDAAKPSDPVFPAPRSPADPMGKWHLDRIIKRAAARAGLPEKVSAHWFRHASASHALDNGATISVVKATLGHASIATTDKYLHVRPGESSAAFLRTGKLGL